MNRKHNTLMNSAIVMAVALIFAGCGGDGGDGDASASQPAPTLKVLSSKPEHVSGGDALLSIAVPSGATGKVTVKVNGTDVSDSVKVEGSSRTIRVTALKNGDNEVVASVDGGHDARLTLVNHPITGPILAGPLVTPFECRTVESGLGEATDENCTATRKLSYYYRTTRSTWAPLDNPTGPRPADLVTTTTNAGKTVPFIVRVDSGTVDRAIYRIAILDNPSEASVNPSNWKAGEGWNGKLAVFFDGGAGTKYNQGINRETDVLDVNFLGRGFAYTLSSELVNRQRGNGVLQGESLMMLKEFFIKNYGVPKWTVGTGSSGGGIQQYVITQIYPGLLDGLIPARPFSDGVLNITDCGLFERLFSTADANVWTGAKRKAVEGFTNGTCRAWANSYVPIYQATNQAGCDLKDTTKVYHPVYNPKGARCTPQDLRVNVYGRDPYTGFARKIQDNIGVQYGLLGLKAGEISVDEFLEVNERIGGNDVDGNFIPSRNLGDEVAIKAAYESGLVNAGLGGLGLVPIINIRNYTDDRGDIHSYERDFTIRARLLKGVGRTDHQVAWIYPGNMNKTAEALDVMNEWLDKIVADPAALSTDKIVRLKPSAAVDACFTADGEKIAEVMGTPGRCASLYPVNGETRLQAGAPITNDVAKCVLKPVNFSDYAPIQFTTAQQARLRAVFPTGVCDFTKPGVNQVPMRGTYQKY